VNGASLKINAFVLIILAALIAIVSDWSRGQVFAGLWRIPAALLLLGLAYESWRVSRSGLALEVDAPEQLFLGRPCTLRWVLRQASGRALKIEAAPSAPAYFEIDEEIEPLEIRPGEPGTIARRVNPCRLGEYSWPPMKIRVGGALGLAWWPKELVHQRRLRVLPDLFSRGGELKGIARSGGRAGIGIGAGAEVLRLREYRGGDAPRVIDWKATARAGRLISRDFAQDYGLQIVIVVDAGRSSALRAGTLDRFGHYVNVAARLAQFAAEREDLVGLVVYADRPLAALAPARGVAAVARLRALLAASRVAGTESNPLYAATRVRSLVTHRSLVVLLTDVDDVSANSQLAQAVRFLLPTHLPFIAGLSSAAAQAMAHAPARHWLDPYRSLAAQEYCIGLERKIRALNALGAPALTARPDHLEHAVFAAYENFRRGRRA
jgi:uncharacterized protein (DUF58 family)